MTKQDPLDSFLGKHAEIDVLLKRIQEKHNDHYDVHPEEVTWGHVGNLEDIRQRLQALSDIIHNEGEYAR